MPVITYSLGLSKLFFSWCETQIKTDLKCCGLFFDEVLLLVMDWALKAINGDTNIVVVV